MSRLVLSLQDHMRIMIQWRCLVVALSASLSVLAEGWSQFRGSNHDAAATDPIRLDWDVRPPATLWKVSLPNGLSSFSVDAGRLFTMGFREGKEYCIALDAGTGRELWSAVVGLASYPNGGVGPDDGTRATPSVEGDRVYAFGAYLDLVCFDAATGSEIWRHDLRTEFASTVIPWQNAASPLLVGDFILVNGNGRPDEHLLAFRKSDGTVAWKTGSDSMTQSSPVRGTLAGVEQVVFFTQTGLVSVVPTTGVVLWRYAIPYAGVSVAASPVIAGDTVYASRAYPPRAGAVVVRVTQDAGQFTATKVWETPNQLMNHWATPVYFNGYYYGMYGQSILNFRAVDASNGATKWMVSGFGYGSVTRVNDKLLALNEDGILALVDTNPETYTELARIEPLQGRCWNNPAVSDGRIYIRSTTEAVALDVSVSQAVAPIKLNISRAKSGDLKMILGAENGAPLDSTAASRVSIYSSETFEPGATWLDITSSAVLTDGKLEFNPPLLPGSKFFRAQQK